MTAATDLPVPQPLAPAGAVLAAALALTLLLAGCDRERREFSPPAAHVQPPTPASAPELAEHGHPFEQQAYAVAQGKRLFRWYNCNGCHAQGGGDMGPPLMDEAWRYGAAPEQIFHSIVQGRPNGMPAFGGRIPDEQVWQLVAYVRSMTGQLRQDVMPSRSDQLSGTEPEQARDPVAPLPPSAPALPQGVPGPRPPSDAQGR